MFAYRPRQGPHPRSTAGPLPRGCADSPRPWPRSPAACWPGPPPSRPPAQRRLYPQPRASQAPPRSGGHRRRHHGWQITLIAVAAALIAATAAVCLDRARAARRAAHATTT